MVPIVYNFRSLLVRKPTTAATVTGIALVVFVLAASLMLSAGLEKSMVTAGRPDHAIVLRRGSDGELASSIETDEVGIIVAAPGVARDGSGQPLAVSELIVVITLQRQGEPDQVSNIQVRGIPDNIFKVRTDTKIIAGRAAAPGTDEVIVGSQLAGKYENVRIGGQFDLNTNRRVSVVGVFEAGGSSLESEVWANLDTVRSAFGRDGLVSSVTLRLERAEQFDALKATLESNKQLGVDVFREVEYYRRQSEGTGSFVAALGIAFALLSSFGAITGATITMHAAVAQRRREIGTLRALGFSRYSIMLSFLMEALLLAVAGGLLGITAAVSLSFFKLSMMNLATFQDVTFRLDPDLGVLVGSLLFGSAMGLFGGFLPALRASRLSPIDAMRA
jgi:putative ABC transport system permease protein